jgi:amino acid adenylation domain-containing protein/thioester reductase-like protein
MVATRRGFFAEAQAVDFDTIDKRRDPPSVLERGRPSAAEGSDGPPASAAADRSSLSSAFCAGAREDRFLGLTIGDVFEQVAARWPLRTAVVWSEGELSFGELNLRANRVARALQGAGVAPGHLVGILLPRSIDALTVLLAVAKCGAAWVPLDPELPESRVSFILDDARLFGVATRRSFQSRVPGEARCFFVDDLGDIEAGASPCSEENPKRSLTPKSAAYVIYTSGSTGHPKGVLLSQAGAVNMALAHAAALGMGEGSRVLQSFSFSFDASVFEVLAPLLSGATMAMAPRDALLQPHRLAEFLRRERVACIQLPPGILSAISPDQVPAVEKVLVGGEVYPEELVARWSAAGRRVFNFYGPTEATVSATLHERREGDGARIIGRPLPNVRVYVLDEAGQRVPAGAAGEIYIGGAGVALGYVNRSALTRERFLADGFADEPGARMYRTGDRARLFSDGTLEFLGRVDTQVKLRGYRIELEEVEACLKRCAGVQDAAAAVRTGSHGFDELIGYVVARAGLALDLAELRDQMTRLCPGPMVPSRLVSAEELPRTPNGKVDRGALSRLPWPAEKGGTSARPRTETERRLTEVLCEVLHVGEVGVGERLIDVGVHSLLALQIASRLRERFAQDVPPSALLDRTTVEALARRLDAPGEEEPAAAAGDSGQRDAGARLFSPGQESLWTLQRSHPESVAYNVPLALRLEGELEVAALVRALRALVERHIPLRTRVELCGDEPRPRVLGAEVFDVAMADLGQLPGEAKPAELARLCEKEVRRPFDLQEEIPFRATLIRLGPKEHILIAVMHHVAADGWSFGVLTRDLTALYRAAREGMNPSLPQLFASYEDFQRAQRGQAMAKRFAADLEQWKASLAEAPAFVRLPADRPRPARRSEAGGRVTLRIPGQQVHQLRDLARGAGASIFAAMAAAVAGFLARHGADEDVVLGTVVANRDAAEWEDLIGYFANVVPMRIDASGTPSFLSLVERAHRALLFALDHRRTPFETLVRQLNPTRSASFSPLVQVMLVLQSADVPPLDLPGVAVKPIDLHNGTAKFDLQLELSPGPDDSLEGWIEYSEDIFHRATIEQMARRLSRLIDSAIEAPHAAVARVPMMEADELARILAESRPRGSFPADACIHELFEEWAKKTPSAVAIVQDGRRITYGELRSQARALAEHLQRLGVAPGARVALCLERTPSLVISVLGVLMAGATYVPIDPNYPEDRCEFMLDDSQAAVVVADECHAQRFLALGRQVVTFSELAPPAEGGARTRSASPAQHGAYIIYTSGTTGRPKGVMITHHNVVRLMLCARELFDFSQKDVWTLFHSYSFDVSVWEMWGALALGGTLVVVPREVARAPDAMRELLRRERVTVLCQTPSAFNQLIEAERHARPDDRLSLRYVILAGEAVNFASLRPWFEKYGERQPCVINMYGITETTVHSTYRQILLADLRSEGSFVGGPLRDLGIYLVDRHGQLVPDGVPGEIWVSGGGVGAGYLNRPELDAQRFLRDPFSDEGGRIYRSGDLARRHPSGDLEYLGRMDNQVKIRGFRIELEEVEACLAGHPEVRQALVVVRDGVAGVKELWAYIAADCGAARSVRRYLSARLPDYMVPTKIIELERFPLTPTGKVDKRALPSGDTAAREAVPDRVPPSTPLEKEVASVWEEVLGVAHLGVNERFFEAGGHSLLAARVVMRLRDRLGVPLPVQSLFEAQTVAELAAVIERLGKGEAAEPAVSPDELVRQATLDPALLLDRPRRESEGSSRRILLTGGTGFLGAYLLHELLSSFDADVLCLVRCRDADEGRDRLLKNLRGYGLPCAGAEGRIRAVRGDLEKPLLGMTPGEFRALAREVDVIYHNGAWVSFLAGYRRLHAANVLGTQEILRLACEEGRIPLHYVSSTGVFGTPSYRSRIDRIFEEDDLRIGLGVGHIGYAQSKWVAEKMAWLAHERGLPVSIFRCGLVMGDSRTGRTNVRDFPSLLIKACLEMGAVYELRKVDNFIPVDIASRAIVHISRQPGVFGRAFHVVNPHHVQFSEFWDCIRSQGYCLDTLSYRAWVNRLLGLPGGPEKSALYPLIGLFVDKLPGLGRTVIELFEDQPAFDAKHFLAALSNSDIVCPPIDGRLVGTWLRYYQECGFVAQPS